MDDKSALLGSLKIDRGPLPQERSPALKWTAALIALLLLAAGTWAYLRPPPAPLVKTVTVRSLAPGAAGARSVLDASGYIVARRQAVVSSKLTGKVVEVLIEEGSHVAEGQVLARLDDSSLRTQVDLARSQVDAARAALTEGQVQLAEAQRQLRRSQELAAKQLLSQSALDTAQASVDTQRARIESTRRSVVVAERSLAVQQQLLEDSVVRAPFAGIITVKNAQPGEMISPLSAGGVGTRTGIGTLVDMDSLEVEVDVNENFINRVTPGQPAEAALNAYPDWKIPASVIAVIPTADRSKATVKVRIRLNMKDPRVIPDMGARVSFLSTTPPGNAEAKPTVLVASEAVGREGSTGTVFVLRGQALERRAVSLGNTRGSDVEIVAGLAGGETLAVGDLAKFADGLKVRTQE